MVESWTARQEFRPTFVVLCAMAVDLRLKVEGVKPRKPHIDFIDSPPFFFNSHFSR
jgi:hypothetical protein